MVAGWQRQEGMRVFRRLQPSRSFKALAGDYAVLLTACISAIAFDQIRAQNGLHWALSIPVFAIAIVFIGVEADRPSFKSEPVVETNRS